MKLPFYPKLWREVNRVMPKSLPGELPSFVGKICDLRVLLVDSEVVQEVQRVDLPKKERTEFFRGGHGRVYPQIPLNEIWIDAQAPIGFWPYILYHEVMEYFLMERGLTYGRAHSIAEASEPD